MYKKLLSFTAGALLALAATDVKAQVSAPKYSNEFLHIGVGGRALGMGNVQSAIVNDATAGYWNPAGLMHLKNKYNVGLMHSELFAGIAKHDFGTFATPLDSSSALAISVIRTGVDNIADTRRLYEYNLINYDNIRFFSVADYALIVSYARRMDWLPGLNVGANAKIVYRNVGDFANAWGFGVDVGAQLVRGKWQLGVMAKDITTTFTAWSINSDELKETYIGSGNELVENSVELTLPRLVLGVGRDIRISDKFGALLAADLDVTFDGKRNVLVKSDFASIDPHVGAEVNYNRLVFLRGGISNVQQIKELGGGESWKIQPNFGVGIATHGLNIDLALSKIADNSEVNSVIVSLGYSFK